MTNDEIEQMASRISIALPEDHYNPTGEPVDGVFIHRPFRPEDLGSAVTVPAIDTRNWWQKTMPLWFGGKKYTPSKKMRIVGIWT